MIRYRFFLYTVTAFLTFSLPAKAGQFTFDTDPFAGTDVLTTPGRQIVGAEAFISFDPALDTFAFDADIFGVGSSIAFTNDVIANLPTGGVNAIVLQTFDNDAELATPFGAGNAANLIASHITTPGAGFFIYFNSGLDLPRLVFSTDLSDELSDLKILARMTNLTGQSGKDALATFAGSNFVMLTEENPAGVPEPSMLFLMTVACAVFTCGRKPRSRDFVGLPNKCWS